MHSSAKHALFLNIETILVFKCNLFSPIKYPNSNFLIGFKQR